MIDVIYIFHYWNYYIVTEFVIAIAVQYLYGVLLDRVERENQASRWQNWLPGDQHIATKGWVWTETEDSLIWSTGAQGLV